MSWLSLILTSLKMVFAVTNYLHDQSMLDAGKAAAIADLLRKQHDALLQAIETRNKANADFDAAAHGGKLPDDIKLRD